MKLLLAILGSAIIALTACSLGSSGKKAENAEKPSESYRDTTEDEDMKMKISVNGTELTATLAETAAAKELAEKLKAEPVTVTLDEYGGFEKVGELPWRLFQTDESTVTEAGDIMLYQGSQMTIFYDSNSWSYTRLGSIDDITGEELADLFGDGSITVTLSY